MKKMIDKVGAIILKSKKILVVRKHTKDNRLEYILPGGKREKGETDEETLRRELKEELKVSLINYKYFNTFSDISVFENIPITVQVYYAEIEGEISPQNEIKDYIWIDKDYERSNIKLGSILSKYIIPSMIKEGLL